MNKSGTWGHRGGELGGHILELRRLVLEARDLREVSDYFDEKLVPDDGFMRAGAVRSNERLLSMARVVLKTIRTDTRPVEARLHAIAEFHMWHGVLLLRPMAAAKIVYFDDINRGVCSYCELSGQSDIAHHFRFSMPDDANVPIDPEGATIVHVARRPAGAGSN